MTLLTVLEIQNNYPEEIMIHSASQSDGKFAGFLYRLKEGVIHKLLVSTQPVFNTGEEANQALHDYCKELQTIEL